MEYLIQTIEFYEVIIKMSKTEFKTIGIYKKTYDKLRAKADKRGHKIIYLANKFIENGLTELELNDKKKEKGK